MVAIISVCFLVLCSSFLVAHSAPIQVCDGCKVLFAIRHGESTWNVASGIMAKGYELMRTDSPLTANGLQDGISLFRALGPACGTKSTIMDPTVKNFMAEAAKVVPLKESTLFDQKYAFGASYPDKALAGKSFTAAQLMCGENVSYFVSNLRRAIDTFLLAFQAKAVNAAITGDIQEISKGPDARSKCTDSSIDALGQFAEGGRQAAQYEAFVKAIYGGKEGVTDDGRRQVVKGLTTYIKGKYATLTPLRAGNRAWGSARCPWLPGTKPCCAGSALVAQEGAEHAADGGTNLFLDDLRAATHPVVVAAGHSMYWNEFAHQYAADAASGCGPTRNHKMENGAVVGFVVNTADEKASPPGGYPVSNCALLYAGYETHKTIAADGHKCQRCESCTKKPAAAAAATKVVDQQPLPMKAPLQQTMASSSSSSKGSSGDDKKKLVTQQPSLRFKKTAYAHMGGAGAYYNGWGAYGASQGGTSGQQWWSQGGWGGGGGFGGNGF